MRPPLLLTSADNPRIKAMLRLREQKHRRQSGCFIAEGQREISRALAAGLTLRQLYICPQMFADTLVLNGAAREAAQFHVTPELLGKMAYNENPQGVLAVFEQPNWTLESEAARWETLKASGRMSDLLLLVAVGLAKPGNLGAMVRSASAAGCAAVLVADGVVDAFNPNAIRASTGAVFILPVVGGSSVQVRSTLAHAGVKMIVTSPDAQQSHTQADLTGAVAIVIGAEDQGLDESWLTGSSSDQSLSPAATGVVQIVRIPMADGLVDSLNASVAAGVLLFEARRQRDA